MKLLPADIVLTSSPNLLSRGLLWGQRDPGESPTRAGHVALVSSPDLGERLQYWEGGEFHADEKAWQNSTLIESTWPRVRQCGCSLIVRANTPFEGLYSHSTISWIPFI